VQYSDGVPHQNPCSFIICYLKSWFYSLAFHGDGLHSHYQPLFLLARILELLAGGLTFSGIHLWYASVRQWEAFRVSSILGLMYIPFRLCWNPLSYVGVFFLE